MKQLFCVFFLLVSLQPDAQITSGLSNNVPAPKTLDVKIKKGKTYEKAYINNIPSSVAKDFAERFGELKASWFIGEKEVTGHFNEQGISRVVYYENDQYVKTRSCYDSSGLANRIRDFLELELGKTYRINLVTEVRWENEWVYEISMVNDTQICIVKITVDDSREKLSVTEKTFITKG